VGLGSPDRGDDAIGAEVAVAVAALDLPHVAVLVHQVPTDLIELWSGHDPVVVVDAVRSGAAAGTLVILETGAGLDPLPRSAWQGTGRGGTHAFGVAEAVELGRALRRLPSRLTIVGIEARAFEHGGALSPEVAAALPGALAAVVDAVSPGTQRNARREEGLDHVPG
jgi:hydrogenase maturation protease